MSLTFTWSIKVNGVLTAADSAPTLSDSAAVYGIKRLDTDAVVVAAGTALTNASTGTYSYTIASPVTGVTYRAALKAIVSGKTIYSTKERTSGGDAVGYYATYENMATRLDSNVDAYSNVEGNGTAPDYDRLTHVLEDADREIDSILRSNGFSTPVPTTSTDFDILTDIACDLAYVKLMDIRMVRSDAPDAMGREMFFKRKNALERLKFLARRGLDATRLADAINNTNGRQPQGV